MWWIGDTYAGNFGPQRSQRLEPFKTWLAKGVQWAGGSDYFVTPYAARYGIWASLGRETLKGVYGAHPFGASEAIDVHTARRSYSAVQCCSLEGDGDDGVSDVDEGLGLALAGACQAPSSGSGLSSAS